MASPTVTSISPANGSTTGGKRIVVQGTNLDTATAVSVGGTAATSFKTVRIQETNTVASTLLIVVVPAHAAGSADVVVTNPSGASSTGSGDVYSYIPELDVTDVPEDYATSAASLDLQAADPVNGNLFAITGDEILIAQNTDASPHSVTISSVADEEGRTGDITKSVAAGDIVIFQRIPTNGFRVANDGTCRVTAADATVKLAVLRLQKQ